MYKRIGEIMKRKEGFTLVELLIVITIVALLLVIAVPNIIKMSDRMKERGLTGKIDAIEQAAITYAQNNSNKLKRELGSGKECNDTNAGTSWCECFDKTTGDYSRHFCKYKFVITVDELIEKGVFNSENDKNNTAECDVADPTNNNKCMDCAKVTVLLDDDFKNVTAELDKTSYTDKKVCN